MQYITSPVIHIPVNKDKRVYPVAIGMVISIFLLTTLLGVSGLVPELTRLSYGFNTGNTLVSTLPQANELPTRIIIPSIGTDYSISNPVDRSVESLDAALLNGVVRYPGSGLLGKKGNMVLFGHSSHLAFVNNKAYQSFNGIENLKVGDSVIVYNNATAFTYKVTRVYEVKNTKAGIETASSSKKLTLVTCNNFGAKEDRFVVEAQL